MLKLPPKLPKKKRRELRVRSPAHLAWVRKHSCTVPNCEGQPIEAAHVRIGGEGGTSLKPGDDCTISLCQAHHRRAHQIGERSFAAEIGWTVERLQELAASFWQQSQARLRWEAKQRKAA